MTHPVPPEGYELVDDEPRYNDLVWVFGYWKEVDDDNAVQLNGMFTPASDLRWIARKK